MTQPMYRSDSLAPVAFPFLADSLRAASDRICDLWQGKARNALPAADEPTLARLGDEIPRILATLASIIGGSKPDEIAATESSPAPDHALPPDLRIDEAMIEYGLLRQVVIEELSRQMGRGLFTGEVLAVTEGLDFYVRQTVVAHCGQQARLVQAASDGQSKYLSFLSHDLRGGLNGMFLMVEVLRRELAGKTELAETLEDLEMMRRSILDTVAMMDRFLYAERFRKGTVRVRPAQMSLKTLLGEIAARFAYQAKDAGAELKVDIMERGDIVTDRELLSLILQGLVSNAIKGTTAGAVEIVARPLEGGAAWKIEVTDAGAGIGPEHLEQILAGFANPAPDSPGMGLGLRLAAQAARQLGAKLEAESTLGKGSRFRVEITQVTRTPHPQSGAGS